MEKFYVLYVEKFYVVDTLSVRQNQELMSFRFHTWKSSMWLTHSLPDRTRN
jgi:hypothetical protein